MLKKAGIVVAAAAVTLLVVSPLAYAAAAGEPEGGAPAPEQLIGDDGDGPQEGLINLGDVNVLNGLNVCPDIGVVLGLGNVLGVLGLGASDPSAAGDQINCENFDTINQTGGGAPG